jgi:hypothetical protein
MSIYTVPTLTAVDFVLSVQSAPSLATPAHVLQSYTVPSLSAVDFAISAYTAPAVMNLGWELLPDLSFPTQYFGLKTYYHGAVKDLCLVAEADAPASMGGVVKVNKNGTLYGVYLVETTDPNASPCYIRTSTGTKAIREKT